jgi:hypothetical protein
VDCSLFFCQRQAVIQKLHDATVATINTPAVTEKRNEPGVMIDLLEPPDDWQEYIE